MGSELATKEYVPLTERSKPELQEFAKKLGLNLPPTLGVKKLAYAIKVEQTKQNLLAEKEAMTQIDADERERLGLRDHASRNPSLEEICIYGGVWKKKVRGVVTEIEYERSPVRRVTFLNTEDPGADVKFSKGGIFFHIFDKDAKKQQCINIMPACLFSKEKRYAQISLASPDRGIPVFADVKQQGGEVVSEIVGRTPRFQFIDLGPAPKDAEFGLYLKESEDDDNN